MQNCSVRKIIQTKEQRDEKTSFLPHHPVTNENKPGKVRRVANASSVFQGQSLNSNLLKGPDLLSKLAGVFLRFRLTRKVRKALITKSRFPVKLNKCPCRLMLLLKTENSYALFGTMMAELKHTSKTVTFLEPQTHRVLPHMLCKKTAHDNEEQFPDALKYVERSICLDDLYVSTNSLEVAQKNTARNEKCSLSRRFQPNQMEFKQSRIPNFIRI